MTPQEFCRSRSAAWARMAELTARSRSLSEDELHELIRLYPSVAVDVSRARLLKVDPQVLRHINSLALAAHGILYREPSRGLLKPLGHFFAHTYPALFRRMTPVILLSLLLFLGTALVAFTVTRTQPDKAWILVPHGLDVLDPETVTAADVSERYRKMPGVPMASLITLNNVQVAFFAFAGGILAGLGTLYVLLANGVMLGAFFGHFHNHGLARAVWEFLTPHGALEIFAILIAGAAGLRLGLSLAIPGGLTRGASLRRGAHEAVLLLLGTIPMFLVAGLTEGLVTPAHISGTLKILWGLALLGATLLYLVNAGRGGSDRSTAAVSP